MSPILVAVSHELAEDGGGLDRLMSTECHARFLKEVAPLISNSSLILCEGFYHPTLIGPDDTRYHKLQKHLLDLPDGLSPTLGGVDFRQQRIRTAQGAVTAVTVSNDPWHNVSPSFRMTNPPLSLGQNNWQGFYSEPEQRYTFIHQASDNYQSQFALGKTKSVPVGLPAGPTNRTRRPGFAPTL